MTDRTAPADTPLLAAIAARWSPRAFRDEPVPEASLARVLEAGRWASSCFNEQPWAFVIAERHRDAAAFARILGLLSENNRKWAGVASVLMVACARTRFAANGNPNIHAWYDLGQSTSAMAIEAAGLGLQLHQMAGLDRARAKPELGIPEDVDVAVAIALGVPGDASSLPEPLATREAAPRVRKPRSGWTFRGRWEAA
jgi:nitroreductase